MVSARRELASMEKETSNLVQALKGGPDSVAVKDELTALEARKTDLATSVAGPTLPALHPGMPLCSGRRSQRWPLAWSTTSIAMLRVLPCAAWSIRS